MRSKHKNIVLALAASTCITTTSSLAQGSDASFDPAMVEAAQGEDPVLIYSAVPLSNWQSVIDAMKERAPWFEAEVLELQSAEVFTRYEIEASSNAQTADMLATSIRPSWASITEDGEIQDLDLELPDGYPDWANEFAGVYTFSINPHVLAYNKLTIPEEDWPTSVADIAALVSDNPGEYDRAISTYTPDNAYGREVIYSWTRDYNEEPWDILETLVPATVEESSGGTMLSKLSAGEYKVAYFQSGNAVKRSSNESFDRVVGWTIPSDGVVVNPMSAGVTAKADSPNSAQLFLEFLLSEEGQAALPQGAGMNPMLGEATENDDFFTYASLEERLGAENVFLSGSSPDEADAVEEFMERWESLRD